MPLYIYPIGEILQIHIELDEESIGAISYPRVNIQIL